MTMYAQQDYPNIKLGNCGASIASVGCFLTSFANLEQRFGRNIDPPTLNQRFKDAGMYTNGCDLAWASIAHYDSQTALVTTGSGVPPTNDSIVEFIYNDGSSTHFCLVNNVSDHTIVDSWDGKIKGWDYYGGPKAWATYTNKGDTMSKVDINVARILSALVLGNTGRGGTKDALAGQVDADLQQYLGLDSSDLIHQFYDSDQGKQFRGWLYNNAYTPDTQAAAKLEQIKKIVT